MRKLNQRLCCLIALIGFHQVNAADYSKMSAEELDAAWIATVQAGNCEQLEELMQAGANPHTLIPYTWTEFDCDWQVETTALTYAIRHSATDLVKTLLPTEVQLHEALRLAIQEGRSDVVQELIQRGADINHADEDQNTPLIYAIQCARATSEFSYQAQERYRSRWSERRTIIEDLLEAGADVTCVNNMGKTALMVAVTNHDLTTVEQLLQMPGMYTSSSLRSRTKPINYADINGNTALMLAIKAVRYSYTDNYEYQICVNSQEIVDMLLDAAEIDVFHKNKNGETVLSLLDELLEKLI